MLSLYASDPLYPDWDALLTDYAAIKNPGCFWNLRDVDRESLEYKAEVVRLSSEICERFEELVR